MKVVGYMPYPRQKLLPQGERNRWGSNEGSERKRLPISEMTNRGEERRMRKREIKMTKVYLMTQPFGLSRCLDNQFHR